MILKEIFESILKRKKSFCFHGLCMLIAYPVAILCINLPERQLIFESNIIAWWSLIGLGCAIAAIIIVNVVKAHVKLQKGQYIDIIITGIVVYPFLNIVADRFHSYFIHKWIDVHLPVGTFKLPLYFEFLPTDMTVFIAMIVALTSIIALYAIQKFEMRKRCV